MIQYMLPGFYEHYELYKKFFEIKEKFPEYFREDCNIYCLYGNFQVCPWDGGRIFSSEIKTASLEKMQEVLDFYNKKLNLPIRYVFTNSLLTEEHCYDKYCNLILELGKNYHNEVVINSPILEKYIRTNYPSYAIISSTTKCLKNSEDVLNEISKDYKLICLEHSLNKNVQLLNNIPQEYRNKVEILVNPICKIGCPNKEEHYRLNSLFNLNFGKTYALYECKIKEEVLHPNHFNKQCISPEYINDIYLPLGITHMKIEGRTFTSTNLIAVLAKYLVKPEYQLSFISFMSYN